MLGTLIGRLEAIQSPLPQEEVEQIMDAEDVDKEKDQ